MAEEFTKFAGLKLSLNVKSNTASTDEKARREALPRAFSETGKELRKPENYIDAGIQGITGFSPEIARSKPGGLPALAGFDSWLKYFGGTFGNVIGGDLHEVSAP
ncbi:hypothetical protein [Deinococcus multiflagellatus]|uniref:Uncharacterized protein n=1 Tax=Deinococcus multiflagellatus TaxID=1656887 RepID=A0ABW1ZNL4_9DEIO